MNGEFLGIVLLLVILWPAAMPPPAAAQTSETETGKESETGERFPFPWLYLGVRGGAALDFQTVRPVGEYERGMTESFGGEGAVTVEYRPWRRVSFQAEGVFMVESFAPYRSENGRYTSDRYQGASLLFPLLLKISLNLDGLRLSPLAGAYYVMSLGKTMNGVSYNDKPDGLPLGVMVGFELGSGILGGKRGELYGGLRYGSDLGMSGVAETGLYYSRSRLIFSLGWRFGIVKK
jgi:hypothetical protein